MELDFQTRREILKELNHRREIYEQQKQFPYARKWKLAELIAELNQAIRYFKQGDPAYVTLWIEKHLELQRELASQAFSYLPIVNSEEEAQTKRAEFESKMQEAIRQYETWLEKLKPKTA